MVLNYSAEDFGAILGGGFVALLEVRADNVFVFVSVLDVDEFILMLMNKEKEKFKRFVVVEWLKWVFDLSSESWWGWRVGFCSEGYGKKFEDVDVDVFECKWGFDEDD